MVFRVSGYILNSDKQIFIALTAIFGIGQKIARDICYSLKIDPYARVKNLEQGLAIIITEYISQNYITGDDLKKQILADKKKYIATNCYRGRRLRLGLPCHGQRTRSNSKTVRMLNKKIM